MNYKTVKNSSTDNLLDYLTGLLQYINQSTKGFSLWRTAEYIG